MPSWKELLDEAHAAGSTHDAIRRKYLRVLHEQTGRNIVVYYSGWQQKEDLIGGSGSLFSLNDQDKNGFMAVIHKLDRTKGLDLLLHTPGGGIAATESLVDYLRQMFKGDVRAVVPQMAMSAGTMLALACKRVLLGKHSSLGPIDPQLGGVPAHGVIEELQRAFADIKKDSSKIPIWQAIIAQYPPTFIGQCEKAIEWSQELVKEWLQTGMLAGTGDAHDIAGKIVEELGTPSIQKSHDRHVGATKLKNLGVHVEMLEDEPALQDAVLTVHHACVQTLTATPVCKFIENHNGIAFMQNLVPRRQA